MLGLVPLLVVPFIIYNLGLVGLVGFGAQDPWSATLFSVTMVSGGAWSMKLSDLIVLIALALLFAEIVKATRTSNASLVDHLLSTVVFIAYLVEFLLIRTAATSLFFILTVISLVDVLAGFSVSFRGARRDFSMRDEG